MVLLSLLCTIIDGIRRKFRAERPVKRILNAADKILRGNFSTRIQPIHSIDRMDGFDVIIDYFNQMAEELSGTETLRTDFIANVSHELKTPLAVMQNYGTMLQQPGLSEEKRMEYAKAITDASYRLADRISNILKRNKLENQQIFPAAEPYNLGEQLCECLLGFQDLWEKKALEIETELADGIMVKSDAEKDMAVVRISDTGCGASQEVGKRMFDKFYQGDTSHAAQGNGLGPALVKRVIDIADGEINVESEVGKGPHLL